MTATRTAGFHFCERPNHFGINNLAVIRAKIRGRNPEFRRRLTRLGFPESVYANEISVWNDSDNVNRVSAPPSNVQTLKGFIFKPTKKVSSIRGLPELRKRYLLRILTQMYRSFPLFRLR